MNKQANKPLRLHLPLSLGAIAAILVSGIALGALAITSTGASDVYAPAESPEAAAAPVAAAAGVRAHRCAECGMIESTREIETPSDKTSINAAGRIATCKRVEIGRKPVRNQEIVVRLQDGSMRVITDAHPAQWRHRERVTIIAGVN
jgi:hypothetical protein